MKKQDSITLTKERKVGEIFFFHGIELIVEKAEKHNCHGCFFFIKAGLPKMCEDRMHIMGLCVGLQREDKQTVNFQIKSKKHV